MAWLQCRFFILNLRLQPSDLISKTFKSTSKITLMKKFLSTYQEKYHLKDEILSLTVLVQCYAIEHL